MLHTTDYTHHRHHHHHQHNHHSFHVGEMLDLTQRYQFMCIIQTCPICVFIQNCPPQNCPPQDCPLVSNPKLSNPEIHCPSLNHPQDHHNHYVQADDGGIDWKPALTLSLLPTTPLLLPNYYLLLAHTVRTLAMVCTLHTV